MLTLKKRYAVFVSLVVMCVTLLSQGLVLHADRSEVDAYVSLSTNLTEVSKICAQANDTCGERILVYTGSDGLLSFSNKLYSDLDSDQKTEFMEVALTATQESSLGVQMKNKVYNFIANQDSPTSAAIKYLKSDASADFVEAKAWFRPFSSPISIALGVICLVIFLFLGLSILFDIAYICLPTLRMILERGEEDGKAFGVSREAISAVRDVEGETSQYKSAISVYFKRRMVIIIIASICLGYVISGQIYDLLTFFVDAFSGMFG